MKSPEQSAADADQAAWAASQPAPKTLTAEALTDFLVGLGIRRDIVLCFDDEYSLPSPDWVKGAFAKSWGSVIDGLKLQFGDDSFDCDDFAAGCRWWAQVLQNRTRPGQSALAFFECGYESGSDGLGEHAICGCVARTAAGILQAFFFEPQPTETVGGFVAGVMKPIMLTAPQIATIYYLRF